MGEQTDSEAQEDAPVADFERDMERLEEIVRRLEDGDLSLDESLKLYEEGIGAFRRCRRMLQEAELKVSKLVETLEGELVEEPFEDPGQ